MTKLKSTSNWALAASKELLSRDVPTSTVLSILDDLLYASLEPLYNNTVFFRRLLMQVILYVTEDNRRRISLVERSSLNAWLLKAVYDNSYDFFAKAKLDRNICVDLVMRCLEQLEPIEQIEIAICDSKLRATALEQRRRLALLFGADEDSLYSMYSWCKTYIRFYLKFKERIISRYYRLAYHESNKMYHTKSQRIDSNDLFKNLVLSTWRAIDRCDASKGHLTTFVQRSYLNAKIHPEFGHEKSLAYDIPFTARHNLKKQHIEVNNQATTLASFEGLDSIEDTSEHFDSITSSVDTNLLLFLRSIEGVEMGLIVLGVPIVLTKPEIQQLEGRNAIK